MLDILLTNINNTDFSFHVRNKINCSSIKFPGEPKTRKAFQYTSSGKLKLKTGYER